MESAHEAQRQLDDLRRAALLAHTRYPVPGPWYPPTAGVMAGLYVVGLGLDSWAGKSLQAGLLLVVLVGTYRYQKQRGTWPRMRDAPAPIRREVWRFAAGCVVLVIGLLALWEVAPWWVVALTAAVLTTLGIAVYERRYLAAARRAEREAATGGTSP